MFFLTLLLVFLVLVGLSYLITFWLGTAIKKQANRKDKDDKPLPKHWFAPIPRPGSFSFVALEGRIVDVIENVVGWKLERFEDDQLFVRGTKEPDFWERTLGVRWIGRFKTIKVFPKWEWAEFQQKEDDVSGQKIVKYEIKTRKEPVSDFFFQFSYPIVVEDAEIAGNIRVNVTTLITILNLHPVRAIFLNKDPVVLFASMIQAAIRAYICDKEFDEIKEMASTGSKGQIQNQELWAVLKALNGIEFNEEITKEEDPARAGTLRDPSKPKGYPLYGQVDPLGVFGKLGQYIVRGEIVQVEAIGDTVKALEAARLAQLNGQADIVKADQAAKASVIAAQGRMDTAERDAVAQRTLLEATVGYFASLPGGARMYVADRVASEESDLTTWVEGGSDVKVTLPLSLAPTLQKPERVEGEKKEDKPPKKSK